MKKLTVKEFVSTYIPTNAKVKVILFFETAYKGTAEDLLYSNSDILDKTVIMIGISEDYISISCEW